MIGSSQPMPIALALDGLLLREASASAQLREAVTLARGARCASIQLNGRMPGLRARELDRSARREVAAIMRREGLGLSGIDLWIPPAHFAQPEHVDRATEAVIETCSLASELARLVGTIGPQVCIELPENPRDGVSDAISSAAATAGVQIADFGISTRAKPAAFPIGGPMGLGLDPASELLAGRDPATTAATLGQSLIAARLTDAQNFGRCVVGTGRLDLAAFKATLAVATRVSVVTLDLRGVGEGLDAISPTVRAWIAA